MVYIKRCRIVGTHNANALDLLCPLYLNRKKETKEIIAKKLYIKSSLATLSSFKLFSCLVDTFWALSDKKTKIMAKQKVQNINHPLTIMGTIFCHFFKTGKKVPPNMPFVLTWQSSLLYVFVFFFGVDPAQSPARKIRNVLYLCSYN